MDIEFEITNLIHKYHIDECYPFFYQSYQATYLARQFMKDIDNVVLVGNRKTDIRWFKRNICDENVFEILVENGMIDQQQTCEKKDCLFLVVSFYGRDKLTIELMEYGLHVECIYDIFEREGIYFHGNFYDIYGEEYNNYRTDKITNDIADFDINKIFFYHRRKFEMVSDLLNKKIALKKIIFDCAYAKDFIQLKKYIQVSKGYFNVEELKRYHEFWTYVEELLKSIKKLLCQRDQQDCLLLWLDALEYEDAEGMPFLGSIDKDSLVFKNWYTVTPYTGATFKCLFAKKRVVEEESYKMPQVNMENSAFFNSLKERNYRFKYYGPLELTEEAFIAGHLYSVYNSLTQTYWDAIRDILMCGAEEKMFCVIHEDFQTHIPYVSLGLTGNKYTYREPWPGYQADEKNVSRQELESREYVDNQLAFWAKLLSPAMFQFYMSDHGHTFLGKYHCILKIRQKHVRPGICEKLISNYDFDNVTLSILDNYEIAPIQFMNSHIIIQDVDYYNKEYIVANLKKRCIPTMTFFGYQGVVTHDDMFIRYNDGVEIYQKHSNDESMVTDDRLNYLRSMVSKKKIDIYNEKRFQYSCLLQKVVKQCEIRTKEREEKKLAIVKKIFEDISEKDVLAIRGGRYAFYQIVNVAGRTLAK